MLIEAQGTPAAYALLAEWPSHAAVAPYVFSLETPWLFLKLERRSRERGFTIEAMERLAGLKVAVEPALDDQHLNNALGIAISYNMGFYDAMYVMLAANRRATVVSRDAKLLSVCEAFGLDVLNLK